MNSIVPQNHSLEALSTGMGTLDSKFIEYKIYESVLDIIGMKVDPVTGFIFHPFNMVEPIQSEGKVLRLERIGKKPKEILTENFAPLWRFNHAEILLSIVGIQYRADPAHGLETDIDENDEYAPADYLLVSPGQINPETNKQTTICSVVRASDDNVCIGQGVHDNKAHSALIAILDFIQESAMGGVAKITQLLNNIQLIDTMIEAEKIKPARADAESARLAKNQELLNSPAENHKHINYGEDAPTGVVRRLGSNGGVTVYDKMSSSFDTDVPRGINPHVNRNKISANTRKRIAEVETYDNVLSTGHHTSEVINNANSQYYGLSNNRNKQRHVQAHNPHQPHNQYNRPHVQHNGNHNHPHQRSGTPVHNWGDY